MYLDEQGFLSEQINDYRRHIRYVMPPTLT